MSTDKLPDGWTRVKFGDVVRKVNDRVDPDTAGIERYVAGEHMDTDDLTIRRWGEVGDGYLGPAFHMRFKPGHVLYGSRRTYLRKVAVADFEGITANTTFVLEPSSKGLLPDFLPLVMTTEAFHEHSIKQSKGSVNPYINFSDLTWYEFALPPLNEQRQIVDVLDSCGAWQDRLLSALVSAADVRAATLNEIDKASSRRCRLGEMVELERGVSYKSSDYVSEGEGRPFLNLKCVSRRGTFSSRGVKWVRSDFATANVVSAGELFFANTDLTPGRLLVGAPFFFRGLQHDAEPCFSMDLTRVRPLRSDVPLEFIYHLLNIPRVRSQMRALTGGSTVGHLRLGSVPDIEVPIVNEPESVLIKLRSLEAVEGSLEVLLADSRDIARSLRERLLAGSDHVH